MPTIVPSDLGLSDDALAAITAQLANASNPDPITNAITRGQQTVRDYTLRYNVEDARVTRLVRCLVFWDLYSNPMMGSGPPKQIQDNYNTAMQELKDIRDGKFPDLQQLTPVDAALSGPMADFGGERHVHFGGRFE